MAQVITLPAVEEGAPVAQASGKRRFGRVGGGTETAFGACLADSLIPIDLGRPHVARIASGEGTWTLAAFTGSGSPLDPACSAGANEKTRVGPGVHPVILVEDAGFMHHLTVEMEGGIRDATSTPATTNGWKSLVAGVKLSGTTPDKMVAETPDDSALSASESVSATKEVFLPDEKAETSNSEPKEPWGRPLSGPSGVKSVPEPMHVKDPSVAETETQAYPREHGAVVGMSFTKEDFVSAHKGAGPLPSADAGSGKHPVEKLEKVAGNEGASRPGGAKADAPEARTTIDALGTVRAKEGAAKSSESEGRFPASTDAQASAPNRASTEERTDIRPSRPGIRVAEFGERVVAAARTLNRGATVKAQLKLVPESLGKLDLEVEWNGRLTVRLTAHSGAAYEAIQRELPHLREALLAAGMDLEGLHLGMEGGGSAREEATAHRGTPSSRRDSQGTVAAVPASRPRHEGILDIEA